MAWKGKIGLKGYAMCDDRTRCGDERCKKKKKNAGRQFPVQAVSNIASRSPSCIMISSDDTLNSSTGWAARPPK